MTSLGLVLLAADDVEEPRTLGTERQQGHLKHSRHHSDAQQDRPQLLAAQQRLQTQDLQRGPQVQPDGSPDRFSDRRRRT